MRDDAQRRNPRLRRLQDLGAVVLRPVVDDDDFVVAGEGACDRIGILDERPDRAGVVVAGEKNRKAGRDT